jgi:hypothetical protein
MQTLLWLDEKDGFHNGLITKFKCMFCKGSDGTPQGHDQPKGRLLIKFPTDEE